MEFSDVIKQRHSVRRFEDRAVEIDKLERILEAGRLAPSTGNRQSATFVVVTDRDMIARIGRPSGQYNKWLPAAPVIIVATGNKIKAMGHHGVHFWEIDGAIAVQHMALAAVAEGLGACWVGLFRSKDVRSALGIPRHMSILALLAVGYPLGRHDGESAHEAAMLPHNRKPMSDFAHWGKW